MSIKFEGCEQITITKSVQEVVNIAIENNKEVGIYFQTKINRFYAAVFGFYAWTKSNYKYRKNLEKKIRDCGYKGNINYYTT